MNKTTTFLPTRTRLFGVASLTLLLAAAACAQTTDQPAAATAATAAVGADQMPPAIVQPVADVDLPEGGVKEEKVEVAESGQTESFSYEPSSEYEGVSVVRSHADGKEMLLPKSFVEMAMKSTDNDKERLGWMSQYKEATERMHQDTIKEVFPDKSEQQGKVGETVIEGTDKDVIIRPDEKAGPYVRVTVTDKDGGNAKEFSIAAKLAEQLLANPYMAADKKIANLVDDIFHLPEDARERFNEMSAKEIGDLAAQTNAGLKKQEFVKMAAIYAKEAERQAKADKEREEARSQRMVAGVSDEAMGADEAEREARAERRSGKSGCSVASAAGSASSRNGSSMDGTDSEASDAKAAGTISKRPVRSAGIAFGVVGMGAVALFLFYTVRMRRLA